jgi:rhodanese-related sulfurtransferase
MAKSMKDFVSAAKAQVPTISPREAHGLAGQGDLILDVREANELQNEGAVDGALHVPRGLLESQADPDTGKGAEDLVSRRDGGGKVHVLCASGARASLAAACLQEMGYDATIIEGGLAAWKNAGLPVEH